ncbi:hypothetical protein DSAG12_01308 [Promethearchaeum syntrophicum]|uniref:Uncharacterized protein n=1 Tax=Promethearchaeum syntrophicum TaxID=2594042 RepID=A0A5B9D8R6_9ARCH|nr:hypothetical protein [Candidatus Prometheoarchaeum syntrophicum]QEE15482.1 hypothetical protein DSAG12_01308 [Candidatus Prometheoarchaeum syntrophicum]
MKIYFPTPLIFAESDPSELLKYAHSIGMIALNNDKELVMVREIYYPSIWNSFYSQIKTINISKINIKKNPIEDPSSISMIGDEIEKGLRYIISKGYIFLGLLYFDSEVLDPQICEEHSWFRKRDLAFKNMLSKYQIRGISPKLNGNYIESGFIGRGEDFFKFKDRNFQQISQSTTIFRGSMNGIAGLYQDHLQFTILSQNITQGKEIPELIFDKIGKQTLERLVKTKKFFPALGFRFDYGIDSFKQLPNNIWSSIELIPKYSNNIKKFLSYLKSQIQNIKSPFPLIDLESPFDIDKLNTEIEEKPTLSVDDLLKGPKLVKSTEKIALKKPIIKPAPMKLHKVDLPTPIIEQQDEIEKKPQINIIKPPVPKVPLKLIEEISDEEISTPEKYEDIFNKPSVEIFEKKDEMIIDGEISKDILRNATDFIESDFGSPIDPLNMNEDTITNDLLASLNAMSELDKLAQKDEAISRIFYPPRALFSYSNKEGMEIGGCTVLVSMGVGREISMLTEFAKDQTWAVFDNEIDEGNPQIKFIIPKEGTFIDEPEDLERIIHNGFINIKRNNHVFLGICEINGNGFETNSFETELEMKTEDLIKLNEIYLDRIKTITYPPLVEDKWIEIHYIGNEKTIEFLTNPSSVGILDIAYDTINDMRYSKGKLSGIICVDEEAAYFFILTTNFDNLSTENPNNSIDYENLSKMYELIEASKDTTKLTPVSWCQIGFGFQAFQNVPLWFDVKDGSIMEIVKENYNKYIKGILNTKEREDELRIKIESEFPDINKKE